MNNEIIHHVEAYLEKVFTKHAFNITDLDAAASALKKDSDELSRNILETLIKYMNESFRQDKSTRKEMGLVLKEKDRPRCILTELGEISFTRDYYYNKDSESYETPLDQMLSIDPRTRVGAEISARLVSKAAYESYERSSLEVTGGAVSRQTVKNQIMKAPNLEKQPEQKKQCKVLDLYADEDHVHLQKPGKERGKKNKVVPLVTVTEGTVKVSNRRNATINPVHFVDEQMDTKDLWASVEGYIEKAYDLEALEEIRLHSDGGKWIKTGLENFPNVVRAMDKWHLERDLRLISRKFPNQHVQSRINDALARGDKDKAEAILRSLVAQCKQEKDFENLQEFQNYLLSNWEACVNTFKEGMGGSCTEGMVSHVLSERFSRNPMGWSEAGLGKLSMLRIYLKNRGEIKAEHFKASYEKDERHKAYARRCLEEQLGHYDLSWMSELRETYVFDTTSGTQQAIKNLGRLSNNLVS